MIDHHPQENVNMELSSAIVEPNNVSELGSSGDIEIDEARSPLFNSFVSMLGRDGDFTKRYINSQYQQLAEYSTIDPIDWGEYQHTINDIRQKFLSKTITLEESQRRHDKAEEKFLVSNRKEQVEWKIDEYEKKRRVLCSADDEGAIAILDLIAQLPSLQHEGAFENAPFEHYRDNTDREWKYVPDQAVRDYMSSKVFQSTDHVDGVLYREPDNVLADVVIDSPKGREAIEVPMGVFANVAGFSSWRGRSDERGVQNGNGNKSMASKWMAGEMKSIDTMKHYASLDTPLPEVGFVYLYIQPDGRAFANNASGDSHRIGAAMLRGEKSVRVKSLEIILLSRNMMSLEFPEPFTILD